MSEPCPLVASLSALIQPWLEAEALRIAERAEYERRLVKMAFVRVLEKDWRRLYFIRCADAIKIGISNEPKRRLADLQMCNPHELTLLGVMFGGRTMEEAFHKRFAHLRIRGEWFRSEPELTTFIQDLRILQVLR